MQINTRISNISFQKKLAANCTVLKSNGRKEPCKIYKLNPNEDSDYFIKLQKKDYWKNANYLEDIIEELPNIGKGFNTNKIYSMENKNGDCIGFAELTNINDSIYIFTLETAPKYVNYKKQSPLKYIGETLLTFVANLAKKSNKNNIKLCPVSDAIGFYSAKCHMDYNNNEMICILPKEKFDTLISQNIVHTGSKINMLS